MTLILRRNYPSLVLFILLFFSGAGFSYAQENYDSLFKKAQELAFSGKYKDSRKILRHILKEFPRHTDAYLLKGNTFAWEGLYDSARHVIKPLLETGSPSIEVYLVMANIELWSGEPRQSLHYADTGLEKFPGSIQLMLSKAKALRDMNEYEKAGSILSTILSLEPRQEEALKILSFIEEKSRKNGMHINFQRSTFDINMAPWMLGFIEYSRSSAKVKYIARVNYGEQFERQSLQAEVDIYPRFGEKTYAYLNAGVSDNRLFPGFRAGAEIYHMLPYKIEAVIGARSLFFPNDAVVLYTGQVGKYFSKTLISFRSFLQNKGNKIDHTGIVQVRQYIKNEDQYISLMAGSGTIPFIQVGSQEIYRLNAQRIAVEGQFRFYQSYLLGALLAYEHEEYNQNTFRNRFTTGIFIKVKF